MSPWLTQQIMVRQRVSAVLVWTSQKSAAPQSFSHRFFTCKPNQPKTCLVVLHLQVEEITFEQLMLALQLIVRPFEGGSLPAESLVLISHCGELCI